MVELRKTTAVVGAILLLLSIGYNIWVGYQNDRLKSLVRELDAKYEAEVTKKAGILDLFDRQVEMISKINSECRRNLKECESRGQK